MAPHTQQRASVPQQPTSSTPSAADVSNELPQKAPFTVMDIKKAIPSHCFKHSFVKSFAYVFSDLLQLVIAIAVILEINKRVTFAPLWWACWVVYWWVQGATMTGLWVLAHECGHGGFSPKQWLNDIVGFCLHTPLFVPYFSWQLSHAKHHHYTNHMTKDEVFVPVRVSATQPPAKVSSPLVAIFHSVVMLTLGWPLYLSLNLTGPLPKEQIVSHFDPSAPIFPKKAYWKIVANDVGLLAWIYALYTLVQHYGMYYVWMLYGPPMLVTNMWLVSITFLQHTDDAVPHYEDEQWTWLRGALCTVDRTLGWWHDMKLHHIVDTHVVHHLFHHMPFYNAQEATVAAKKFLGNYHKSDTTFFFKAFYNNMRKCNTVTGENGILHFVRESH